MASYNQLFIRGSRERVEKKIRDLAEESRIVTTYINGAVLQLQERISNLSKVKEEDFFSLYHKLKKDLEIYEDKLCFIQTALNSIEESNPEDLLVCKTENPSPSPQEQQQNVTSISNNLDHVPKTVDENTEWVDSTSISVESSQEKPPLLNSTPITSSTSSESSNNNTSPIPQEQQQNVTPISNNLDHAPKTVDENTEWVDSTSISVKSSQEKPSLSLTREPSLLNNTPTKSTTSSESTNVGSQRFDSQSSLYQSLSDVFTTPCSLSSRTSPKTEFLNFQDKGLNFNESNCFSHTSTKSVNETEVKRIHRALVPYNVLVPSPASAFVTHIIHPRDFWMQIQDASFSKLCSYPLCRSEGSSTTLFSEGDFCLAPYKREAMYRAVIQSIINAVSGACAFEEEELAKVFFVDFGYSEEIPTKKLKRLPEEAYDVPILAIHCFLAEVYPVGEEWCSSSIEKFKELIHNHNIEPLILCKDENMYGVQLPVVLPLVDISLDIASMLLLDGLAVDSKRHQINLAISDNCNISSGLDRSCDKKELDLNAVLNSNENRISCDSGVSVTSYQGASSPPKEKNISYDSFSEFFSGTSLTQDSLDACPDNNANFEAVNKPCNETSSSHLRSSKIGFGGYSVLTSVANDVVRELKLMDIYPSNDLHGVKLKKDRDPIWDAVIPPPVITFVERNMMLVMMSYIVNPGEFYVHLAQENSSSLDDLQEQMSDAYGSMKSAFSSKEMTQFLRENTFCSAPYDQDGNWYRAKIIHVIKAQEMAEVQFIDYGNKALISVKKLRPLLPELAKYPVFAVKCTLGMVMPLSIINQASHSNGPSLISRKWDETSVNAFKNVTGFDKCLTAQVIDEEHPSCDPLPILLWDNQESQDLCINEILVAEKVAEFTPDVKRKLQKDTLSHELSVLGSWNPMEEHFNRVDNSYGVNATDLEVATVGYKANDESYICKFFARNGRCPRGDNCEFRHIVTDIDGVTQDQDEAFSFDCVPPLPEISSYVLVEISAVINPGHFYVVFPFGSKSVDEIDETIRKGASMKDIVNLEPKLLSSHMSKHYNNTPFRENTAIALAIGTIVVAKSSYDTLWHRARVITVENEEASVEVFFVDRGYREVVPRKLVREIMPAYTHMPFQAVECFLCDVEPKNRDKGGFWTPQAKEEFQKLVESKILLSCINHRDISKLYVTLKNTTQTDHGSISELLVAEGHAQYVCQNKVMQQLQKSTNRIYLPG